jgi:nucleoside-diphosphate-sugar epimerase
VVEGLWRLLHREDEPPMTSFLAEQLGTAHWFDQRETRDALRWAPHVGLAEGFDRLADWFAAGEPSLRQSEGRSLGAR